MGEVKQATSCGSPRPGYEKPGETTASASGLVTVRYQWSDGALHMLDTLPAAVTG